MSGFIRTACIVFLSAGIVSLAACTRLPFIYQPEVQQGNIVTSEMVEQLQPGMSKRQVRFIMGSPAIEDMFRTNRWDYVHSVSPGGGGPTERLTLHFDANDQLERIEGDLAPSDWRQRD